MHEIVLQRIRLAQRLVLLGECALDADAVGDVDEGQHRLGIGQRNDRVVEDEAGAQLQNAAARRSLVVEAGDDMGEALPAVGLVVGGEASLLDRADMGARLRLGLADAPDRPEGRVGEPDAAVGAENGDALGEMVDRFALT